MISPRPFGFKSITVIVIAFEVCADVSQHLIIYHAQKNAKRTAADPCSAFSLDASRCSDLC